MSGVITREEDIYLGKLKETGKIKQFTMEEFRRIAENGFVSFSCADGDTDIDITLRRMNHRPHSIRDFGLPLSLVPLYGQLYKKGVAEHFVQSAKLGMEGKQTKNLLSVQHAPCLMATTYKHSLEKQFFEFAPRIMELFRQDPFFNPAQIYLLFHVMRITKKEGVFKQGIYRIIL